jgi:hypothetical protein
MDYRPIDAEPDHRSMQSQAEIRNTSFELRPRGLWACLGPRGRSSSVVAPRVEEGFRVLAEAFQDATDRASGADLTTALVEREREIHVGVTIHALRSLVGLACRQTGETPRSLLEAEIAHAPHDDLWRAEVAVTPLARRSFGRG